MTVYRDPGELHDAAMDLIEKAEQIKDTSLEQAHNYTIQALQLATEAAMAMDDSVKLSKSRSIMFMSAVSIAFTLGRFEDALKLANAALSKEVHPSLKAELEDCKQRAEYVLSH